MQTIVELPEFQKRASSLLKEDERTSIIITWLRTRNQAILCKALAVLGSYGGRHKEEVKVVVFG